MDEYTPQPGSDGFTTSQEVGDLMSALAKAQAVMENPDEDSDNPYFQSRYASLGAVINAVLPPLNSQGIAVTQFGIANLREHSYTCTTVFWLGNQFLQWRLTFPVVKTSKRGEPQDSRGELNKQDYAGVNTYARRIMLMGMAGVAGEPDDDGNEVETQGKGQLRSNREKRPEPGNMLSKASKTTMSPPAATEDTPRLVLVDEIGVALKAVVVPFSHAGLYKAVLHHCFEADHYTLRDKPLAVLEAGMPLFRHLCEELQAQHWERSQHPDEWIAEEQRKLAALARGDAPREDEVDAPGDEGPSWGPGSDDLMKQEEEEAEEAWDRQSSATSPHV